MTAWRVLACLALVPVLGSTGCTSSDPPTQVQRGDPDGGGDDYCEPPCSVDGVPPEPWDTLTWELTEIDVGNPTLAAGIQNRMIRMPNGDIHIAYFKLLESEATCEIAVFAGGTAPAPTYQLRVATLPSGGSPSDWTIEEVRLENILDGDSAQPGYATSRYGIDATVNGSGQLVVALAAGDAGLAQCGSTQAVTCTRAGAGSWSCTIVGNDSGDCCLDIMSTDCQASLLCQLDYCADPACVAGAPGDVGSWSAIATADNGTIGVAFTDVHNFWGETDQTFQGLEFNEGSSVTGIRPWSSNGKFAALTYDGNTPVVAFTSYTRGGLSILHRPTTNGDGNDWVAPHEDSRLDVWNGYQIGERIQLEKPPSDPPGRDLGLLFHAYKDRNGTIVNDLVYCRTMVDPLEPDEWKWEFPCNKLVTSHIGAFPGLAYDNDGIPYVVYRYCGTSDCRASQDGVRFAWLDDSQALGRWWRFIVHNESSSRSGLYNQVVVDPESKEPIVAFQHLTRGSLVIAHGHLEP